MKEIKYGDVFKIKTEVGKAYLQYVKEITETQCQIVRILPGVYRMGKKPNLEVLVHEKENFFVHFRLKDALEKRRVKLIGSYVVPENVIVPRYYRYKHIVQGEFISWHIVNIETQQIRPVKELNDKEKTLSPANIWNDLILAERIAEGWKPQYWK